MSTVPVDRQTAARPRMPPGPIAGPSAWRGADLVKSDEWIYRLSTAEIAEIDAALARVAGRSLEIQDIRRDDVPLPRLGHRLIEIRRELLHGRGFVLIRGLPVERYTMAEAAIAYWSIGMHLGTAVSQNAKGHLLGHVRDLGYDVNDPNARVYQTTKRQTYHTDSCDLVGLLCLRRAKVGGLSSIVSSVTAYNEMRARRPDLVETLFEPFYTDRRNELPPGMNPWFAIPVFNWHAGLLSTIYARRYIESAQRFAEVPGLTPRQIEALDTFDAIVESEGLVLNMDFEPGDIQFLHNHQILHDRTEYEDWPEPDRKRHLLRLWLCPPDGRPLPPVYAQRYGSVEIGRRGGIVVGGATPHVPLEP